MFFILSTHDYISLGLLPGLCCYAFIIFSFIQEKHTFSSVNALFSLASTLVG